MRVFNAGHFDPTIFDSPGGEKFNGVVSRDTVLPVIYSSPGRLR
ncbi:hypothetical protein [Streptomyces sp. NPDC018693]